MKKIALITGTIIGVLLTTNSIIHMNLMYSNPDYQGNDVLGYTTIFGLFSMIYFGVRYYRNKFLDGNIQFSKAFKMGVLVCFIASTIYVVVGLLNMYLFMPDFLEVFVDNIIRNTPPEEVEAKRIELESLVAMYENPLLVLLISYMEVFPFGIIVALISALLVKTKKVK